MHNLERITAALIGAGRAPKTPAAIIAAATTSAERILVSTLARVAQEAREQAFEVSCDRRRRRDRGRAQSPARQSSAGCGGGIRRQSSHRGAAARTNDEEGKGGQRVKNSPIDLRILRPAPAQRRAAHRLRTLPCPRCEGCNYAHLDVFDVWLPTVAPSRELVSWFYRTRMPKSEKVAGLRSGVTRTK